MFGLPWQSPAVQNAYQQRYNRARLHAQVLAFGGQIDIHPLTDVHKVEIAIECYKAGATDLLPEINRRIAELPNGELPFGHPMAGEELPLQMFDSNTRVLMGDECDELWAEVCDIDCGSFLTIVRLSRLSSADMQRVGQAINAAGLVLEFARAGEFIVNMADWCSERFGEITVFNNLPALTPEQIEEAGVEAAQIYDAVRSQYPNPLYNLGPALHIARAIKKRLDEQELRLAREPRVFKSYFALHKFTEEERRDLYEKARTEPSVPAFDQFLEDLEKADENAGQALSNEMMGPRRPEYEQQIAFRRMIYDALDQRLDENGNFGPGI
ncbi:hypothetical protein CAC42_5536 [Sphaceloma murrayae]|uniref:Uncharacterized protein n=1 Tax=Sphaceloma murrayae TaxID=2082308 RepID=A0A2K1QYE7_9PEZI|nr:hypothetical protein CAC42_5536 [Sphaceloma murrayae]